VASPKNVVKGLKMALEVEDPKSYKTTAKMKIKAAKMIYVCDPMGIGG
jgi:hypothetical protein